MDLMGNTFVLVFRHVMSDIDRRPYRQDPRLETPSVKDRHHMASFPKKVKVKITNVLKPSSM